MPPEVIVLGGVVVALLGYVAVFGGPAAAAPQPIDVWQMVAQRRGGTESGSLARGVRRSMDVRVAHVVVRAELHVEGIGEDTRVHAVARARWAIGRGPNFRVQPRPAFEILRSAADAPSVGDADFHRAFSVSGSDYAAVQHALTTLATKRLVRVLRRARLHSDGEHVTLTLLGGASSERELDSLLDVVGQVASAGANGLDVFAALEGAELTHASGTWSDPKPPTLRIATPHGECLARLRWVDGAPAAWLSYAVRGGFPAFDVRIQAGRATNMPAGLLSEYAIRLLRELEDAQLLATGGTLELRWNATPPPTTLLAGAKLLAELSDTAGREGPFR